MSIIHNSGALYSVNDFLNWSIYIYGIETVLISETGDGMNGSLQAPATQ